MADPNTKGDQAMPDTKYLQKRDGCWYIRVARPPKSWGLGGKEFLHSLKTGELRHAQRLRDKHLCPILAEDSSVRMVEAIARILGTADADMNERLRQFGIQLGDDGTMSLADLAAKFIAAAEKADYKPATVKVFRSTLKALIIILGDDLELRDLKKAHILKFRDTLVDLSANWLIRSTDQLEPATGDAKSVSPRTIQGYLRRLNRIFAWAIEEDIYVGENPVAGVHTTFTRRKTMQQVTVEEADALLAMPYPKNKNVDARAWTYMPLIARYTGARIAEIGQLRREDVVKVEGTLCLSIGSSGGRSVKTESSERLVPVSDKLRPHILKLHRIVKQGRLFPNCGDWKDKNGYVQTAHGFKLWNRHVKDVGAHISFHAWRRYAVTQMANAGVAEIDRMRIVGHAVGGTHAIYTGEDLKRYKEAVDRIP
jgi:integrase